MKLSKFFYFDLFLSFSSLLLFLVMTPDIASVVLFFSLIIYLFLTKRMSLFYHLILSFVLSFLWMFIAKDWYNYHTQGIYIFGIRIFTLLSWTLGLFIVYLIYSHLKYLVVKKSVFFNIGLFTIIYWPLLLIAETVGYHVFNIKNFEGVYSGLPICDCMHAVWWMKLAYFSLGIIYIISCYVLSLEK